MPERMWRKAVGEDADAAAARSRGEELRRYAAVLEDLAAHPLPVPQVPVVLLASRSGPASVWHRAYAEYVASVPGARLEVAGTRSHMVPLVDPSAVAGAVLDAVAGRDLIEPVRGGERNAPGSIGWSHGTAGHRPL